MSLAILNEALSLCRSVSLSLRLSVSLSLCISASLSRFLLVSLSLRAFVSCLSLCLSISFVSEFICLSVLLFLCLSIPCL